MEKLAILEAILFISPKPLTLRRMMKSTGVHREHLLKRMIDNLNKEYEDRNSGIRIFKTNNCYVMNILPKFAEHVRPYAVEAELRKSEIKVLAYISRNNGILKSKLIRRIGIVYDRIKSLEEKGFVKEMPEKRSSKLFVTKKFKDYFGDAKDIEDIKDVKAVEDVKNVKDVKAKASESLTDEGKETSVDEGEEALAENPEE